MQAGLEFGVQRLMYRPRTLQPGLAGEGVRDHRDMIMSLAIGQVVAMRMAGMLGAFVENFQGERVERGLKSVTNPTISGCHKAIRWGLKELPIMGRRAH